jgi:V/A-type H+-transporting ATPase subunit I
VDLSIYTGICIGIFFISLSFFLNIFSLLRRKAFSSLVFGEGGILWMLNYWLAIGISIKAMVFRLPVSSELLLLGGLVLVVATMLVIRKGNPFQNLFATMIRLFEHAVNTISFARLGAFALAHGALFLALFSLADIVSDPQIHGPGYWFIILLGNLFIIGLEGVVVTIQTLRLEYYEFFKRFFRGGGHPYTPYRLESE